MGIIAGKIVVGSSVAYEKPTAEAKTTSIKSLTEIRRNDPDGNPVDIPTDKRLSSYFVVNKESDYLDHNKKT